MDRDDGILMELLQEKKTVVNFLDAVFGFMARRTDFYHIMKEGDTIGFPPGVKENLVQCALKKYDVNCRKSDFSGEREASSGSKTEFFQTSGIKQKNIRNSSTEAFQKNEYDNGCCFENYCWNQSICDVEIHVLLPQSIITSKELNVRIDPDYLKVSQKQSPNAVLLEGKLSRKCRNADAVWSMSGGRLQISMDKIQEVWWDRFFQSEPPIDLSRIDCSRPIEELPEESQEVLKKLKFDQQQKLLGLPTSEDKRNKEILRAAWNAEGSPFKGQPFDPSLVHFN